MDIKNLINKIKEFPSKIDTIIGELLKENLVEVESVRVLNKSAKTIMYKYFFKLEEINYILIEEYLFKERETNFDLRRAVGKNFYIYKDE